MILDGIVNTGESRALHGRPSDRMIQTDDLAQAYWDIAHQPKSVWTHEPDLRSSTGGF
jgi:hypothetical protein